MVKFGFSVKKKARRKSKTKAELWQEAVEADEQKTVEDVKQKTSSSSRSSSTSSFQPETYEAANNAANKEATTRYPGINYEANTYPANTYPANTYPRPNEDISEETREVTVQRNNSHPGYDPFSAEEYIPATKRRSQFDSSVLQMRAEEYRSLERNVAAPAAPHTLSHRDIYETDRPKYTYAYTRDSSGDDYKEPGPYRRPSSMYRVPSLDSSDEDVRKQPKRKFSYSNSYNSNRKADQRVPDRIATPTTLSDISEDKERHFTQQERRRRSGAGSIGSRITQMCDSVAEGISETLSRFFNSTKLFFKTCFWSGRAG